MGETLSHLILDFSTNHTQAKQKKFCMSSIITAFEIQLSYQITGLIMEIARDRFHPSVISITRIVHIPFIYLV